MNSKTGREMERDKQFLSLMRENQDAIFAYVLAMVHNSVDAEDIVQETFAVMWRKFDMFQPGTSFAAWGFKIARLQALRFIDKACNSKVFFSEKLMQLIADSAEAKLEIVSSQKEALRCCLKKLTQSDYDLIQARYEKKITTKKLADIVGVSVHVMYGTMSKIYTKLRLCIRRTLAEESVL